MAVPASVLLNRVLARGKFRHLQVLLRVAELGSVQRAADAIGVTQSSVTQTLAYLETLLDERLFHRHARGVTPTPVCIALLPVARQMLMGLAEGTELLAARQRQGGGLIRVLASQAAIERLLRDALPAFHAAHPTVQLHLREAEGEDQLLAVARGEVDLVVCRRPVAVPEDWQFDGLCDDQFVVVCGAVNPVLRRRRIHWAALGRESWMLAPAETAARLRFDEMAQRFEAPPRTHPLVTRSLTLMRDVLAQGPWLALLPLSIVARDVAAGRLACVPLPERFVLEPLGLLRPQRKLGEATQRLLDHLTRNALGAAGHGTGLSRP